MEAKTPPHKVLRDGAIKASLWTNSSDKGEFFSVSFARTYEKDGTLADSFSFSVNDLLKLSELARQAYHLARAEQASLNRFPNEEATLEA